METKIKTFEDACAVINHDPAADLAILAQLPQPAQKRAIANYKLDIIIPALNDENQAEKWVPDYSDYNQLKYKPYFDFSPGSGWSCDVCDDWSTYTNAGARREFRNYEIMMYAVDQFIGIYSDILD